MARFNFFSNDVAIDLGTANTLIWMKNKGIVLNEPSIVAFNKSTKNLIAIGHDAKSMLGKTHKDIEIVRPIADGAIANFEITEGMIRAFIRRVSMTWQPARRVIVSVPSGLTEVEKRAVRDSCEHAGAKEVHLIAEPMASAIGVGLDVQESLGNMVVDIGGGTTEIAVIALSGIVKDKSFRVAGDELTQAILDYFKNEHNILIGEKSAEEIKCNAGSAVPLPTEIEFDVRGRDLLNGVPKMIQVTSADIRDALSKPINLMVKEVLGLLEITPPELSADIYDRGIMLTGGGALLKGLDEKLRIETQLPVHVADEPLLAVAKGVGKVLENFSEYSDVLMKSNRF